MPRVPSGVFDQPASVRPAVDLTASPVATVVAVSAVTPSDIPMPALRAYKRAETLLAQSDPSCHLPWTLLAAIGRVESNHGRTGGNTLGADGVSRPGIYGIALDGSHNTATIDDSDDGRYDRDERWDRAVGPMQFIPGTWAIVAIDSDNDGVKDPQNILDAAAAAGVYLCGGSEDLSKDRGARTAVHRYNHSSSYVDLVMGLAREYASGRFTDLPMYLVAAPFPRQQLHEVVPAHATAPETSPAPLTAAPVVEADPITDPVMPEPVTPEPVTDPVTPDPVTPVPEPEPVADPVTPVPEPVSDPVTPVPEPDPVTDPETPSVPPVTQPANPAIEPVLQPVP